MTVSLEAEHIDGNFSLAQIGDNAFATFVERAGDDYYLMVLVKRIFVKRLAKPFPEIFFKAAFGTHRGAEQGRAGLGSPRSLQRARFTPYGIGPSPID